jgi:antitoxin component of MazEF toxin-antitoxin module
MLTVKIRKMGLNSCGITIPTDVIKMLNLEIGQSLELTIERNIITLIPQKNII